MAYAEVGSQSESTKYTLSCRRWICVFEYFFVAQVSWWRNILNAAARMEQRSFRIGVLKLMLN